MKKLIFLIAFLIGLFLFFPFDKLTEYYVNKAIKDYKINLTYAKIDSSLSKTELHNVKFEGFRFDKITVKHSLLNCILKKNFFVTVFSEKIKGDAVVGKEKVNFKANVDSSVLSEFDKTLKVKGIVHLKGDFNLSKMSGKCLINSDKILYKDKQWGELNFKNVEAVIILKKNIVTIKKFSSQDIPLKLKGRITLNGKNFYKSRLDLKGSIDFAGMKNSFKVKGTIKSPRIY